VNEYTITVESTSTNKAGRPMIGAHIPGVTNRYPMNLNLTDAQGEALDYPRKTEYQIVLVPDGLRTDRETQQPKSGQYPSDYYYNVVSFEGIVNEPAMQQAKSNGAPVNVPAPRPVVAASAQAGSKDPNGWLFNTSNAVMAASNLKHKSIEEYKSAVREIAIFLYELQDAGYTKTKGIVDPSYVSEEEIDALFDEEEEYGYPEPESIDSRKDFDEYLEKAGLSINDVVNWLASETDDEAVTPEEWILQAPAKRDFMSALVLCIKQAGQAGLEPPTDFRVKL